MKRFDMEIQPRKYYMGQGESYEVSPYESTNGEWVQWDDVERLEAMNAELLEALERLASAVCHLGLTEYHGSLAVTVDAARAAIAKAKGESNE